MYSFILVLPLLITPESATFKIEIDSAAYTKFTIMHEGKEFDAGCLYRTQKFIGDAFIEFQIKWLDGDELRIKKVQLYVRAGYNTNIKLQIPKVRPNVADVLYKRYTL